MSTPDLAQLIAEAIFENYKRGAGNPRTQNAEILGSERSDLVALIRGVMTGREGLESELIKHIHECSKLGMAASRNLGHQPCLACETIVKVIEDPIRQRKFS